MKRFYSARLPALLGIALLGLVLAGDLARSSLGWPYAKGWEYEWIAQAWADGDGYSMRGKAGALSYPEDRIGYYPSAYEEPVPVFLLGTYFWLFGDHGRLAMTVTNALCFAATLFVVYRLGRRIQGPWLGFVSAALLAMIPTVHSLVKVYLGGTVLGGLAVSICALVMLWFLERVSVRRGLLLGVTIGVAALTQAATILFAPVGALLSLLSTGRLTWRGLQSAGVIVGAALLMISPWTLRNYMTFGELVLVRNGAGSITFIANRGLAEAADPTLVADDAPFKPPWTAKNLLNAVQLVEIQQNRRDIETYALKTVGATVPDHYADFNEAQRDKALMAGAFDFMLRHPLTTLQLATVKAVRFIYQRELGWRDLIPVSAIGLLAVLGFVINLKDRRVMALGLMALAYAGVYVITYPFYYRYRYPIEPVLVTLAGVALVWLAQVGWQLRGRLFPATASEPHLERAGPGG